MTDWLEEVLNEGELELLLPAAEEGSYSFRRAAVLPYEEDPAVEQVSGVTDWDGAGLAAFSRLGEESPLMTLYRRAGETLNGSAAFAPTRREVVVREAAVSRPGITVRELDLAVRRDSRRYDGGMNPY